MNGIETNGENSSPSPIECLVYQSCKHLKNYKDLKGFTSYTVLHAYYVTCTAKGSSKLKVQELECSTCHRLGSRIHACLYCVHFGCFLRHHIHEHAKETDHYLSMDVLSGTIYCSKCQDYIYDEDFSSIAKEQKEWAAKTTGVMSYTPWEPTKEEILEMKERTCMKLRNDSQLGLRGLINLGSTCFMSSIVQVFVHTPLLRDYYLSDEHKCCEQRNFCEACLMYDIFQEFYSGRSTPFSIEQFLFLMWKNSKPLAGNDQHDAQEFLSYVLPAMHLCCETQAHNKRSITNGEETYEFETLQLNPRDCNCIIHQIFSGFHQRHIFCPECKKSTKKLDPFWDVSLFFEENLLENKVLSLESFLKRYTSSETVHARCEFCKNEELTLKVTLKKLPIVMCIYLNRQQERKINNKVIFPEYLDVTDYKTETDESDKVTGRNVLTLFAVICHNEKTEGGKKIDGGGHYYCYVRQHGDTWYECNDALIKKVDIKKVLNDQGYLLFYHQRTLEYELTQENEHKIFASPCNSSSSTASSHPV